MIKVLYIAPLEAPRVIEIENNLETFQSLVGGYIQTMYPWEDEVAIICDDEGKVKHSPCNRALEDESGEVYDIIAGNFVIVGLTEEGFGNLSDEHIVKYRQKFRKPEIFMLTADNRLILWRDKEKARVIA